MNNDKLTFYFRGWCAAEGILANRELCQKLWDKVYRRVENRNRELYDAWKKAPPSTTYVYMKTSVDEEDVHEICKAIIQDAEFKDAFENLLK